MRERLALHRLRGSLKTLIKSSASQTTPLHGCSLGAAGKGPSTSPSAQSPHCKIGFSLFLGKHLQDSFNKENKLWGLLQGLFKANHQLQFQQQTGDWLGLWNKSEASVRTHRLQAGEVLQHMASVFLSLTGWLPPHRIALDENRTALCQTVVPKQLWCKV